jgi:hypothetical protein
MSNPDLERIIAEKVKPNSLKKTELVHLLQQANLAYDNLQVTTEDIITEQLGTNEALTKELSKSREDLNKVTTTAEEIIRALNSYHGERTQALFTIFNAVQTLLKPLDYQPTINEPKEDK